jgi:hypothetical protein
MKVSLNVKNPGKGRHAFSEDLWVEMVMDVDFRHAVSV